MSVSRVAQNAFLTIPGFSSEQAGQFEIFSDILLNSDALTLVISRKKLKTKYGTSLLWGNMPYYIIYIYMVFHDASQAGNLD